MISAEEAREISDSVNKKSRDHRITKVLCEINDLIDEHTRDGFYDCNYVFSYNDIKEEIKQCLLEHKYTIMNEQNDEITIAWN